MKILKEEGMRDVLTALWGRLVRRLLRRLCDHPEYRVLQQLGPTYRGKIWQACQCKRCSGYFIQELRSGYHKNTDNLSLGIKEVL